VFGQVYGYAAAASRWGVAAGLSAGLCWGLELYMRRLFVNRQRVLQQTQPATAAAAAGSADGAVVTPVKVKVKSA
jgi:thiamine transporter ThiT